MFDEALKQYYREITKKLITNLKERGWEVYFFENKDDARQN